MLLSHQNTSNKEWQCFKAIELCRMSTCLPALEASHPSSRVMVIKTTILLILAKASGLGDTSTDYWKQAGNQDANFCESHDS